MKYITKNVTAEMAKVTLMNLDTFDTKTRIYNMKGAKTVEKADKDAPMGWTAVECNPYKVNTFVAWELPAFMSSASSVDDREALVAWCNENKLSLNGLVTRTISTDRIIAMYIDLTSKERGELDVTGKISGKPNKDKINVILDGAKRCYGFRTEPVNRLYFMSETDFVSGGNHYADRDEFARKNKDAEAE